MRIMNNHFKRFRSAPGKGVRSPILAAGRKAEQRVFVVYYISFVFRFTKCQVDVVSIEGNGRISSKKTGILAVGRIQMKIAPQSYVAFCSRNMLSFCNFLPLAFFNVNITSEDAST